MFLKELNKNLKTKNKFIIGTIILLVIFSTVLILNENRKAVSAKTMINQYMDYLKELIFMSTYDSLKKGNMRVFNAYLQEIGTFKDVKEFSLLNSKGQIGYSSRKQEIGKMDGRVSGMKKAVSLTNDSDVTYYFPVLTVQYCTRCHTDWERGSVNSYYKVVLSRKALLSMEHYSVFSTILIILSVMFLGSLIYTLYETLENVRVNEAIRKSEHKYRSLFENMLDVQYALDRDGRVTLISPSGVKLLGYESEEEIIRCDYDNDFYFNSKDRENLIKTLAGRAELTDFELVLKTKDGRPVFVETNIKRVYDENKKASLFEGVFRDVSDRKQYEEQLLLLASVFENSIEGILITDASGNIKKINPAFTAITGYTEEEVIGKTPRILKSGRHEENFYEKFWKELFENGQWVGEMWNKKKSGEIFPEWLSINAIRDEQGEIINFVSVFHDITEIKESEEQLKFQAYHDSLTGLPNRQLFKDRLEMAIAYAQRHEEKVAVLFIDLDNFKNINDQLGHDIGDSFLIEVSDRLKSCCRSEDTVARLGGDEFMIILPDVVDEAKVVEVAERVLSELKKTFVISGHEIHVSGSIGITKYPRDGKTVDVLVKNADMAMYKAKEKGKAAYHIYDDELHNLRMHTITIETSLRKALELNEIRVYYQPKVDMCTGKISGCEALVRWYRMGFELVNPADFIPIAEETGLIIPIGEFVLRTACNQMKAWHNAGFKDLTIAVNLSAKQFNDRKLLDMISDCLESSGLEPEYLNLEVTENIAMNDTDSTVSILDRISNMGVKLSLDDFGTGYSSLSYLKKFKLDTLKIDRIFINDIPHNEEDTALVDTVISLAENLKMSVVAEGVENMSQYEYLKSKGCHQMQGFLFSRPIQGSEFTRLLLEGYRIN